MTDTEYPGHLFMAIIPPIKKQYKHDESLQKLNDIVQEGLQKAGLDTVFDLHAMEKGAIAYAKVMADSTMYSDIWQKADGEWNNTQLRNSALIIVRDKINELAKTMGATAVDDDSQPAPSRRIRPSVSRHNTQTAADTGADFQKAIEGAILGGLATVLPKDASSIELASTLAASLVACHPTLENISHEVSRTDKDPLHIWINNPPQREAIEKAIPDPSKRKYAIASILGDVEDVYRAQEEGIYRQRG